MRRVLLAGVATLAACLGNEPGSRPDGAEAPSGRAGAPSEPAASWDRSRIRELFPSPPARIVSLVPSFSGTLLALGEEDRLVGRTDFDTAAALSRLPSVGNGLQPSVEAIVSLDPDVVLGFGGPSDPETARRLGEMGIPFVGLAADGIEEVMEVTRLLGALVHRDAASDSLVLATRRALDAVGARTARRPRVRAILLIGGTPPWVAGPGSYMDQLLEIAGGENAFGDLDRAFGPVSPELLATREFDVVLASPGTRLPPAIAGAHREDLPPGIEVPGPGMAESAIALARILHPEISW